MAKRLIDIKKYIESEEINFEKYLKNSLDNDAYDFITELSKKVEVYIFSGIIRNYFLKIHELRDIDIFIEGNIDIEQELKGFIFKKNSFGGYKVAINDINLDLWFLQDTWVIKSHQPIFEFDVAKYIPTTAFFNFSAIIFSVNKTKFYSTIHFNRFIRDKKIDLVYKPNANYALCVVNTFYYSDKLKLKIANKLKKHLCLLHKGNSEKYEEIQIKHFGEVIYTKEEIDKRISNMQLSM